MVRSALAFACALLCVPAVARAQIDLISTNTLHGVAELRAGAGDVERDWTDGGQGKSGLAHDSDIAVPRAALTWTPTFGVGLSAHVTVQYEPQASPNLDVNEAYFELKAPPL